MAAAYIGEIFRSGIQSVEAGQLEASRALGFSYPASMRLVVVPQGIRRVLPALVNQFISLLKASSLVYFLGLIASQRELFQVGRDLNAQTGNLSPLVAAGLFYLVLTIPLTHLVNYIDARLRTRPARRAGGPADPLNPAIVAGDDLMAAAQLAAGLVDRQGHSPVLRPQHGAARRRHRRARGHHRRGDRAVRLGQVDAAAHAEPAATNPTRATSCSTAGRCCSDNPDELRQRIGMVFQQFNLFPHRTRAGQRDAGAAQAQAARPPTRPASSALAQLDRVGLRHKADARPGNAVRRPAAARRDRPRAGHDARR